MACRHTDEAAPVSRRLAVTRIKTKTSVTCATRDCTMSSVYHRILLPFGAMLRTHRQFAQGRFFRDCAAVGHENDGKDADICRPHSPFVSHAGRLNHFACQLKMWRATFSLNFSLRVPAAFLRFYLASDASYPDSCWR